VESAASILAAEQHRGETDAVVVVAAGAGSVAPSETGADEREGDDRNGEPRAPSLPRRSSSSFPQLAPEAALASSPPSRTYLILFEMNDEGAADQLVELLDGQPYTCLDEQAVCTLRRAVAIRGEDGVSLLSPFFATPAPGAAAAKSSSGDAGGDGGEDAAAIQSAGSAETASRSSSSDEFDARIGRPAGGDRNASHSSGAPDSSSSLEGSSRHRLPSAAAAPEDYNCAVCLERLDWDQLGAGGGIGGGGGGNGEKSSILTTVCKYVVEPSFLASPFSP
jgi:hypothetical protein